MDNPELAHAVATLTTDMATGFEDVGHSIDILSDALTGEIRLLRETAFPLRPTVSPRWTWPNPGTVTQGFLANRWQRRDGNAYTITPSGAPRAANSPIAGGDDANASVYVPSGAPRV